MMDASVLRLHEYRVKKLLLVMCRFHLFKRVHLVFPCQILVIREENGERKSYSVNLTSGEDILNSPVFYLQQNDVVYVEPNKAINVKGSSALTYLSAGSSIIGVLASILSLVFILTK